MRTQLAVTASEPGRQKRGDIESATLKARPGSPRNLFFDLCLTHDRYGSSAQPNYNGLFTHPQNLHAPLHLAAKRKIDEYERQYAKNQNITFLPAVTVSTSTRMHGEFLRLFFLQAHRETASLLTTQLSRTGMPSISKWSLRCLRSLVGSVGTGSTLQI